METVWHENFSLVLLFDYCSILSFLHIVLEMFMRKKCPNIYQYLCKSWKPQCNIYIYIYIHQFEEKIYFLYNLSFLRLSLHGCWNVKKFRCTKYFCKYIKNYVFSSFFWWAKQFDNKIYPNCDMHKVHSEYKFIHCVLLEYTVTPPKFVPLISKTLNYLSGFYQAPVQLSVIKFNWHTVLGSSFTSNFINRGSEKISEWSGKNDAL